jgi:hypothetical protein
MHNNLLSLRFFIQKIQPQNTFSNMSKKKTINNVIDWDQLNGVNHLSVAQVPYIAKETREVKRADGVE